MKRIMILLFLFLMSLSNISAQTENIEIDDRHYAGGSFGLQLGSLTNINVAPHYGYYFLKKLSAGIGMSYQYYHNKYYQPPLDLNIFGGSVFARFDIIDQIYLHAEYEVLTYKTDIFSPMREFENIISENLLAGAGYRQFFSEFGKDNAYIMLLYNFYETQFTPYGNPVIRIGLEFHF